MASALVSASIVTLIFGGCCSNVFALEAILKHESDSGLIITFAQFLTVTLLTLPTQLSFLTNNHHNHNHHNQQQQQQQQQHDRSTLLKPTAVPFRKWAVSAGMFFAINMLNNWAFAFRISVPAHIILRSFGSVMTMGAGWLSGKRYGRTQVAAVVLLTGGVLVSAWADAEMKGKTMHAGSEGSSSEFAMGLLVLFVAQALAAWMGIYVQDIYAHYETHWLENLFYSHFLSLPLFIPLQSTLRRQYAGLADSPLISLSPEGTVATNGNATASIASNNNLTNPSNIAHSITPYLRHFVPAYLSTALVPQSIALLAVNALTQFLCISGVYLLSARSSAVTVTIVLNVRKLVSFMFSVWLFGNELSGMMFAGAVLVFGAGGLYGWESSVRKGHEKGKGKEREEEKGKIKVNGENAVKRKRTKKN